MTPEYRTIQRNTSDINDAIANRSDPSLFADKSVDNDLITKQAANSIVQVPAFSNYHKVKQLMQAVDAQIRTASNPTAAFETFIRILGELSLDPLADKLVEDCKYYRRLKSGYRGPPSFQGGSGPAPSSTSSQKESIDPPKIIRHTESKSVATGADITMTVQATGDNLRYQWKRDNVDLSDDDRHHGTGTDTLRIVKVEKGDSKARYQCSVKNEIGEEFLEAAVLTVIDGIKIIRHPESKSVATGADMTMTVQATGDNLHYQWQKNGVDLSDDDRHYDTDTDTLRIVKVEKGDSKAHYRCHVKNEIGEEFSEEAVLTVINLPKITRSPESQSVSTGADISFSVEATGDDLQFQWQKDGADIDSNDSRFSSSHTDSTSTLRIQRVQKSDEGHYRCLVKNPVEQSGVPSEEAELAVGSAPHTRITTDSGSYPEPRLKLNEKNILNVLHEARFADGHWELLGQCLITRSALLTIRASRFGEANFCMIDTIVQWLRTDLEASWEKLAEAVARVEEYGEVTADIVRYTAYGFQRRMATDSGTDPELQPKFNNRELRGLMRQLDPVTLHINQTDETTMMAVQLFARQVVFILHTCNRREYWAALERLEPPTKEDGSKIRDHPIIYPHVGSVIGWFAGYRTAVVRTGHGNECLYDLTKALTQSFPNGQVIIGAGIAYANNRKCKFADVLISDQIENFVQYKKVGDEIINCGPREEIGSSIQRVFENSARDWTDMQSFTCAEDGRTSVAHIGCIVSAPTLIRDEVLRDQLMKHTPNAIGGEMEGWVLLELKRTLSQHNKDVEVTVIKGVADYGDLKMGDEWQWTAAKAAIDCIHCCLNNSGGIEFNAIDIATREAQYVPTEKATDGSSGAGSVGHPLKDEEFLALKIILKDHVDKLQQKGLDLKTSGNSRATIEEVQHLLRSIGENETASDLKKLLDFAVKNQAHYEAYQQALEGSAAIPLKYLKVLFFGPPRTGKTAMRRRLVGEIQNLAGKRVQASTDIADFKMLIIKLVSCAKAVIFRKENSSHKTGKSVQASQIEKSDAIVNPGVDKTVTLTAVITKSKSSSIMNPGKDKTVSSKAKSEWSSLCKEKSTDLDEECRLLYQFIYGEKEKQAELSSVNSSQESSVKSSQESSEKSSVGRSSVTNPDDAKAKISDPKSPKANPSTQEDEMGIEEVDKVFKAIEKVLHTPGQEKLKVLLDGTVFVNMIDMGGQPAFLEMLPALTIGSALYLIFFRLDQELKTRYPVLYGEGGKNVTFDDSYTNEEVIFQALSSIACFHHTKPDPTVFRHLPKPFHAAMLMGTHKDELGKGQKSVAEELKDKSHELEGTLGEIRKDFLERASNDHLMLAVDNMNGDETELEAVKKRLEDIINLTLKGIEIPASWLMFGIFIRKMNKPRLHLSQCREIGRRLNVRDTNEALWFLHHYVGNLMHFSDVPGIEDIVICDPQVVFDSVTNLILNSFELSEVKTEVCDRFKKTGRFSFANIAVDTKSSSSILSRRQLVKLLEHLNVIAPIQCSLPQQDAHPAGKFSPTFGPSPQSDTHQAEKEYFMPAVLKCATENELHVEHSSVDPVPLMIRFKCGLVPVGVPVGVFCAMIANLVAQKWSLVEPSGSSSLYKNIVKFRMHNAYYITLVSRLKWYEIHVARICKSKKTIADVCKEVRETVCTALDQVVSKMNHNQISSSNQTLHELGFQCPEHLGEEDYDGHLVTPKGESQSANLWSNNLETEPMMMICCRTEMIIKDDTLISPEQHHVWFGKAAETSSVSLGLVQENHSKPKFLGSERADLLKQINPVPFQQTDEKALQLFADQVVLILHTCNVNEYCAALEKLKPPTKEDGSQIGDRPIIYPQVGSVIGWFAGYRAAVVRTGQGNECRYDLTTALTKSFQKGRVIIGAGIAYANNRERKFADVLISKQIENFVQYKIVNGDVTNRGPREEIALNVQRVFENPARDWTDMEYFHCADDGRTSAAHIGCIVSAPTLIRDEVLRDQLMKHTPNAIGGEMEGWVLLELKKTLKGQHNKDIEIIVIKGVADYGDLSKGDEWQWTAAKAAIDCIHYCLNQTGGREFGGKETSIERLM